MVERIFLGGGGNKEASKQIDELFINTIKEGRLEGIIYIPVALASKPYENCLEWFSSIFASRVSKIEMWINLENKVLEGVEKKMAVYIGGGDTLRLMNLIRDSEFDKQIISFVKNGGVVYGGSAGAIILGKDIRTAPEARNSEQTEGLDLIGGYSIACHYKTNNFSELMKISKIVEGKILAIEENAGIAFNGREIKPVGSGKSFIIKEGLDNLPIGDIITS
ncbi:MAG: hypothetical protein COV26_00165 [Candidatus Nealsonbacteria bacterium CG10_big_fil_rev_8_21_14_0_10_36_23]|uniref:Peptidase n=1 Tax=Candidatus Nealsonbacteria bacterium CG10_big_fil_rev_8_21_14_0_10_36_23 TaxID=1974709 RepID=A0A2H0TNY0_9BACT|nr:MAG: hypothetical protein COV26_00165 [Candidatus Nealsonbacteria bacterium CG10_big_fil_rev_8_21_14_0_10_36_23]